MKTKNIFSFLAPLALGVALTACEDVPAPYAEPVEPSQQGGGTTSNGALIDESFATQLGSFTNYTTSGSGAWKIDFKTAKASGYDNKSRTTTAGTYYLVSKEVDLSAVKSAHISMDYILRYNKGNENQQLLITDKFDANAPANGWTVLNQTWIEGSDWKTFSPYKLNLPAEWLGKKVRLAFRYNTNAESGSTWEVKNFKFAEGAVEVAPGGDNGNSDNGGGTAPEPSGENLLTNGGFETWTDGVPNEWKSTSTASSANLKQSSTAHSGNSSVWVEGHADFNKRIAYKELTLKAGTYTMYFYVRGESDKASVRPGYAVVENGQIDSKTGYKYGNYTNDIKSTEWMPISHQFTLDAETTVCLLVMNPKGKGSLLIDDFSLTTPNGGIVKKNGGDVTPPPTPNPGKDIYAKSLLDNAEGWMLNEGTVPAEFPQIWQQSTKYGLVATGYEKANKKRHASAALAVSPAIQLEKNSTLSFEHAANFFNDADLTKVLSLLVREVGKQEWTTLTIPTMPNGKSFTYVASGNIDLSAWADKKVQFGFKYTSTGSIAGTWEFKNIVVK